MSDHAEDEQLAHSAAAGDRERFRELVERHRDSVFRFAFHMVRDPHTAEDAAQDTFVKAFRRIGSFDPKRGLFSNWLLGIARNTCLDAIAKRTREQPSSNPEFARETGVADRAVESREIFALLDAELDALAEPFRSTFILAEIDGHSLQEIADLDGVALGTVKSRLSRAREKLRAKLEPLLTEPPQQS